VTNGYKMRIMEGPGLHLYTLIVGIAARSVLLVLFTNIYAFRQRRFSKVFVEFQGLQVRSLQALNALNLYTLFLGARSPALRPRLLIRTYICGTDIPCSKDISHQIIFTRSSMDLRKMVMRESGVGSWSKRTAVQLGMRYISRLTGVCLKV
jgi:hypothetical protein